MKIGFFGAGCIGVYLGAHLIRAGHSVVLLGRESLAKEVANHGVTISNWRGDGFSLAPDVIAVATDPVTLIDCDVIFVTVKSNDTAAAAADIHRILQGTSRGSGCVVVSLQNGVRNPQLLAQGLPGITIIAGMVPFNVVRSGLGCFHAGTSGYLVLGSGSQPEGAERADVPARICQLLCSAGLAARTDSDIHAVQWGKLILNLNNAVNALSGLPLRQQLLDRRFRTIVAMLMAEALALLGQAGIRPKAPGVPLVWLAPRILRLPNALFTRVAGAMLHIDPMARSSMWDDLQRGRLTEIDFINGEVVRLASTLGKTAPLNERVTHLVKLREVRKESESPARMTSEELYSALT